MSKRMYWGLRLVVAGLLIAGVAVVPGIHAVLASGHPGDSPVDWTPDSRSGVFIYYDNLGEVSCRPATGEEALALTERGNELMLRVITAGGVRPQEVGLNIILRGTQQLDAFPEAREAFLRAAARLQALVFAPITVVVDVDFGPTRFGQPFPPGVVGVANSQQLSRDDSYSEIRDALIAGAGSAQELALYNSLPQGSLPTDLGNTNRVFAASALLRALGLLPPVADPDGEQANLGNPPSVVFNSNAGIPYDFDPRDGITPGQLDFEAVATHEIIHVLGFSSLVGLTELNPNFDLSVAVGDLFRFRPGVAIADSVSPADFTSSQRVISSGGEQVFFAGGSEVPLSTGRVDGSGGDGFQASHWKDDRFVGQIIGVMDPIIMAGDLGVITDNDLRFLNAIGYGANQADAGAPVVSKIKYNGLKMVIKGNDLSGDLQLEVNFEIVGAKVKPKPTTKKAIVKGSAEGLNLNPGANQIRVIRNGMRSNVVVLNL